VTARLEVDLECVALVRHELDRTGA
jgi:hypothetical protein